MSDDNRRPAGVMPWEHGGHIESPDDPATKADLARLETLINERLPHVEMVAGELVIGEPLIDVQALAKEIAPYLVAAFLAARNAAK